MENLGLLKQRLAEAMLELLRQRLREAEDDVRRLREAIAVLERDTPRPPPTRRRSAGSGGRQAARTLMPEQLLKLIPSEGIARVKLDALTGAPGGVVLVTLNGSKPRGECGVKESGARRAGIRCRRNLVGRRVDEPEVRLPS